MMKYILKAIKTRVLQTAIPHRKSIHLSPTRPYHFKTITH